MSANSSWNFSRCSHLVFDQAKRFAAHGAAILSRCLGPCRDGALGILTYHRIAPRRPGEPAPTWNVTPARFTEQIQGLIARGFHPLAMSDALEYARSGEKFPRRSFIVTFDDGYEGVYRYAYPVLRRFNVPATIYLATAYLDQDEPFPFDDWARDVVRRFGTPPDAWRPLTREQCREMASSSQIELGCHTHTHQSFVGDEDAFRRDVAESMSVLSSEFGVTYPSFSFPFGRYDEQLLAAARYSGLRCALTTQIVTVQPGDNPYGWGRFGVDDTDSPGMLAGKLDGWYTLLRDGFRRVRPLPPDRRLP